MYVSLTKLVKSAFNLIIQLQYIQYTMYFTKNMHKRDCLSRIKVGIAIHKLKALFKG